MRLRLKWGVLNWLTRVGYYTVSTIPIRKSCRRFNRVAPVFFRAKIVRRHTNDTFPLRTIVILKKTGATRSNCQQDFRIHPCIGGTVYPTRLWLSWTELIYHTYVSWLGKMSLVLSSFRPQSLIVPELQSVSEWVLRGHLPVSSSCPVQSGSVREGTSCCFCCRSNTAKEMQLRT